MKDKKLFTAKIIIAIAILAIVSYAFISFIAQKPTITEAEFPFTITYELDGEKVIIDEVYKVHYAGNDGYADTKTRTYVGEIGDMGEDNTMYILKQEGNTRVELCTYFYPDYMMGDAKYDYFEGEAFKPVIYYYDAEENEYHDEATLLAQGVELIDFEYPTPIENSLVFSHISYCNGEVVLPALLIAVIALIATIILVRKEKELKYKKVDIVSTVLNFIIGTVYLAFVTILALLIDLEGGGPDLYYQITYFIPALSVLCIAASVALRRKGYGVKALIAELIGPAVFALYVIVFYGFGLFLD